ncbi:MAG: hypothetical protein QXK49_03030 [Candidatus Aenigmatarchaeota archaeon]
MKGQIFIIISVLILIALYMTSTSIKTTNVKHDETFYQSFTNLKNELIKTIDLSLINQENLEENLNDFIDFSKEVFKKRGYIEKVEYSISYGQPIVIYLNVSLSSANSYLLDSLIINRTVYS